MSFISDLDKLDHLQEIFEMLSSGKHIDATYNSELWTALQGDRKDDFAHHFKALGMKLKIDPHNFAYFDFDETNQKASRQIILLFILLFKFKSDEGANIIQFTNWILDEAFFENLRTKNIETLDSEGISEKDWLKIIKKAEKLGFIIRNGSDYYLLPATWRFLDLFMELSSKDNEEIEDSESNENDEDETEEEE